MYLSHAICAAHPALTYDRMLSSSRSQVRPTITGTGTPPNPLAAQVARQIQQPELVAHFHKVGTLCGQNTPQRTVVTPGVRVRQHPPVTRIENGHARRRHVINAPESSHLFHTRL